MNYVNKTVDKSEPSFPDNSDRKAEFLYGVFNEETESRYTPSLIQVNGDCSPILDKYDGWRATHVFFSKLNNFCLFKLAPAFWVDCSDPKSSNFAAFAGMKSS